MYQKRIIYNRIFPKKEGINFDNLQIDEEAISFITNPYDSDKISMLITNTMATLGKLPNDIVIVDATACAGGDTITFCHKFGIVIPIELQESRYKQLINNLNVYSIQNAYPEHGDSMKIIPNIKLQIDVIFMDVPWGGPHYKLKNKLELTFAGYDLDVAIKFLFDKRKDLKIIVLKLPKNYDNDSLKNKLGPQYKFILYEFLKKINVIIIHC